MNPTERAAYQQARDKVLAAQETYEAIRDNHAPDSPEVEASIIEVTAAHEELATTTEPLEATVQAAWNANAQAVWSAEADFVAAREALAVLESVVSEAALARTPPGTRAVLTQDEIDRCREQAAVVDEARDRWIAAQAAFKAGVTVEQLDEVSG